MTKTKQEERKKRAMSPETNNLTNSERRRSVCKGIKGGLGGELGAKSYLTNKREEEYSSLQIVIDTGKKEERNYGRTVLPTKRRFANHRGLIKKIRSLWRMSGRTAVLSEEASRSQAIGRREAKGKGRPVDSISRRRLRRGR